VDPGKDNFALLDILREENDNLTMRNDSNPPFIFVKDENPAT